jgi:hypothetical protein
VVLGGNLISMVMFVLILRVFSFACWLSMLFPRFSIHFKSLFPGSIATTVRLKFSIYDSLPIVGGS